MKLVTKLQTKIEDRIGTLFEMVQLKNILLSLFVRPYLYKQS